MVRSLDHKIPLAACNEDLKCSFVTVFSQYCLPECPNDLMLSVSQLSCNVENKRMMTL